VQARLAEVIVMQEVEASNESPWSAEDALVNFVLTTKK
jgi:hypothetical protein